MMKVSIIEKSRQFNVYVGDKLIGTVKGKRGSFLSFSLAAPGLTARPYHGSYPTLRRAMQAILVANGFGKSGPGYKTGFTEVA